MNKKFHIFVSILLLLEIVIIVYITSKFHVKTMALNQGAKYEMNDGWIMKMGDSTRFEITDFPVNGKCKAGTVVTMENVIPKEYEGLTLSFLSVEKTVTVYIDDECVYDFGMENNDYDIEKCPGSIVNFVDIPVGMKEGKIRIESTSTIDNMAAFAGPFTVAHRDIVILQLIVDNIPEVTCSILLMAISLIMIICGFMNLKANHMTKGLFYLALFCFAGAVYFVLQVNVLQIVYGNSIFYMQIQYVFLSHLVLLIAAYYKSSILEDYAKIMNILVVVSIINIIIQNSCYLFDIYEYRDMVFISYIIIFLGIILSSICLLGKCRNKKNRMEAIVHLLSLLIMSGGSVIDMLRDYTVRVDDMGRYSRVCTLVFCCIELGYHVVLLARSYSQRTKENAVLLEREIKQVEEQNRALRRAKNDAEEARAEAIRANAAKDNFLARISHEIRTPINAVLGMDSMILRETENETIKNYALDIRSAGKTLLSLINDILDFSKIESGNLEILPVEYDVSSMLHDIFNMINPRLTAKKLEFRIEVDPNIPSKMYGDDVRIRQILTNILTNAVKYTHEGTVTFRMKAVKYTCDSVILHVEVSDTGIGIKEEDLKNISIAFKRIEESRNRNIEGTGLGLNITVQLLHMMGSELRIESEYGKGSTFYFDIEQKIVLTEPVGDIQERINSQNESYEYATTVYAPDANILVVDDNEMNIKVFKGLLKHTGVKVMEAESGMECLTLVQEYHYDIIFMDHMMPELDGIETLQHMQELEHKCKDTPVIVLTANAVVGAREMYLAKGFQDFLSKPVIPDKLEEALRQYLPKELLKEVESSPKPKNKMKIEELPPVEGIDWGMAILHFTDIDFLIEAVTNMYLTLESNLEQIEQLSEDIDNPASLDNYRIKVHAMKSTMAIIGAMPLSGLARLLEFAARDGEIEAIKSISPYFIKECKKLKQNLDVYKPEDNRQEANKELIITLFVQLKKKVEELDVDAMDEIMGEIKKYHVPECEDLMEQLLVDVSNIDMEQIIIKSDKIIHILGEM